MSGVGSLSLALRRAAYHLQAGACGGTPARSSNAATQCSADAPSHSHSRLGTRRCRHLDFLRTRHDGRARCSSFS